MGIIWCIASGVIMGGAMGAAMALGGAAGLTSLGISVAGFGIGTATAIGLSIGIGVSAGFLSYSIEHGLREDKEWTVGGFFGSGFMGGLQAGATFGLAYAGGRSGLFTNKLTSMSGGQFLQHMVDTTGKVTWAQATIYTTQFIFSSVFAKLLFSTLPGSLIRKLIEKIIKG